MQSAKFVKVVVAVATALWLTGCASTGEQTKASSVGKTEPSSVKEAIVSVTPVVDPAVQAVVESGKVNESPKQIQKMLNKDMFHFAFDSAKLEGNAYQALDVQAIYLNSTQGQNKNIVIQGNTDERGTRTYNLALGERRANAVKDYLVAKDVAASRIEVVSFGAEKPLDTAHNKEAWAQNRRAVIIMN